MIHYHGTPVGCAADEAAKFLAGRRALIPFARPDDAAAAARVCRGFVLDNSAFSLWRKGGGDVDVPAYHAWVESFADCQNLDWCLIPDKIDGTEAENVELVHAWLRIGCRAKSVPVWHLHESLGWLDHLVRNFDTVALGSSGQWAKPGMGGWWDRIAQAMTVACDETGKPRAQLHGLRMLNPEIFTRIPLASADSANAAINSGSVGRFGQYVPKRAWQRATVIAWIVEEYESPSHWTCSGLQDPLWNEGADR